MIYKRERVTSKIKKKELFVDRWREALASSRDIPTRAPAVIAMLHIDRLVAVNSQPSPFLRVVCAPAIDLSISQ